MPLRRKLRLAFGAALVIALMRAMTPLSARINRPGILYWHGDSDAPKVALTFDDGPNEPYTHEVLEILHQNGVRATFFLVGKNVETYPDAAREIVREGHVLGNHSYSHHNLIMHGSRAVRDEIQRGETAIWRVTGERPALFRPPYGDKDFLTVRQTSRLGYVMVEWSVTAQDWRKPGVPRILHNVLAHVRNGSIILMHDGDKWRHGGDRSQTVAALPVLIAELRRRGFELVTVPELLHLPAEPVQLARLPSSR